MLGKPRSRIELRSFASLTAGRLWVSRSDVVFTEVKSSTEPATSLNIRIGECLLISRAAEIDDTLGWILLAQGEADRALTICTPPAVRLPRTPISNITWRSLSTGSAGLADAQAMLETLLGSGVSFSDRA